MLDKIFHIVMLVGQGSCFFNFLYDGMPMSPLLWLQRLFVPQDQADATSELPEPEENEPFVFTQHLRIILAIVFSLVSAGILWWIMA